jgi:Na+/citrate or Na+/malate symporter
MKLQSNVNSKLLIFALFSGAKAGAIGGSILGITLVFWAIGKEILRSNQIDLVSSLILFPYFIGIGIVAGVLIGAIIGLVFGIVFSIHGPIKIMTLKKYSLLVGGVIGAIYPLTWLWANIRLENHSEYIEIGIASILLILWGCYTALIGWKTFVKRATA